MTGSCLTTVFGELCILSGGACGDFRVIGVDFVIGVNFAIVEGFAIIIA